MRFVAIMKSEQTVIKIDTTHSIGRTRCESGRAGYDAFMHHFKQDASLCHNLGTVGANMFRDAIENCIDDQGNHNGHQIGRSFNGRDFLPNLVLRVNDGHKERIGQMFIVIEIDGNHNETDDIMRQVVLIR